MHNKQVKALINSNLTSIRYQLTNHLGSASIELNETGEIISYEEYHPFGTTSYRSGRSEVEVSLKRYKYVFKELDNETGLYYYGMRYYAAHIARFISVDPLQFEYPIYTPFQYAGNKPISYIDLDGAEEDFPHSMKRPTRKQLNSWHQDIASYTKVKPPEKSARFYVVSMGGEGTNAGKRISQWSDGKVKHIKVPENTGKNSMSYIVNKINADAGSKNDLGVALIMFIGVHGWENDADTINNEEGYYHMYAYNNGVNRNNISGNDWGLLRGVKFIDRAILFSPSCNFNTNYTTLSGETTSGAKNISSFTIASAIGGNYSVSAEKPPDYNNKTHYFITNYNKEFIIAEYGQNVKSLGSNVDSRQLINMATNAEKSAKEFEIITPSIKSNIILNPTKEILQK